MAEPEDGDRCDYVLGALPGVQRFLSESRSTADLHAASRIMSLLAGAMVEAAGVACPQARVVVPASRQGALGLPNRVAVLTPPGAGPSVAKAMSDAAVQAWERLVADLRGGGPGVTPGFPALRWVVVESTGRGYADQARRGAVALDRRKRVRDFPPYRVDGRPVCTVSGRWGARDDAGRIDEALSVVADVKRRFREWPASGVGRFPSTASVASAAFRAEVAERCAADGEIRDAVAALRKAVVALRRVYQEVKGIDIPAGRSAIPGLGTRADGTGDVGRWLAQVEGGWCYPESWAPQALSRRYSVISTLTGSTGRCSPPAGGSSAIRMIS